jgi:hypothetical protein
MVSEERLSGILNQRDGTLDFINKSLQAESDIDSHIRLLCASVTECEEHLLSLLAQHVVDTA